MGDPLNNLRGFQLLIAAADKNGEAERCVREMIRFAAEVAPVCELVRLAECVVEIRKEQIQAQGEAN